MLMEVTVCVSYIFIHAKNEEHLGSAYLYVFNDNWLSFEAF